MRRQEDSLYCPEYRTEDSAASTPRNRRLAQPSHEQMGRLGQEQLPECCVGQQRSQRYSQQGMAAVAQHMGSQEEQRTGLQSRIEAKSKASAFPGDLEQPFPGDLEQPRKLLKITRLESQIGRCLLEGHGREQHVSYLVLGFFSL